MDPIKKISIFLITITIAIIPVTQISHATSASLMGLPTSIAFTNDTVSSVSIFVKKGWLNSDKFELDIFIEGLNGGLHYHGQQRVQLSATTVFGTDKDVAEVYVDWNTDNEPRVAGEIYSVFVQVILPSGDFGELKQADFGPF